MLPNDDCNVIEVFEMRNLEWHPQPRTRPTLHEMPALELATPKAYNKHACALLIITLSSPRARRHGGEWGRWDVTLESETCHADRNLDCQTRGAANVRGRRARAMRNQIPSGTP